LVVPFQQATRTLLCVAALIIGLVSPARVHASTIAAVVAYPPNLATNAGLSLKGPRVRPRQAGLIIQHMRAMVLSAAAAGRVDAVDRLVPSPSAGQLLVRVRACGVCRTDLHVVDGELPSLRVPIVPGHEIVGVVEVAGADVHGFAVGDRVGVPWLGWTCGSCHYCRSERENLCRNARFTGYQIDGGFADYTVADARFAFRVPDGYDDVEAAPLLCAGLIGYRSYRMVGDAHRLGLYGFGAAAHLIAQVATHEGREVYAFTSPGDRAAQQFARSLGCAWAGASTEPPPARLDAAIIFAPVGRLVPEALSRVEAGGTVVCAGIHMSDVPSFPYRLLWEERAVRSVANLTRRDGIEFLALAPKVPVRTHVQRYDLAAANTALADLREGRVEGAAVLVP
jgi:alcohol dehydrogenase, propanol-preferring